MNQLFFPTIQDGEDKNSLLKNCIRNNYRHLRKWAKRTSSNAFRIYDREVKGYPCAIDYYDEHYCIQYYTKDPAKEAPPKWLESEICQTLVDLFQATPDKIYWKTRKRRDAHEQYEKISKQKTFFTIKEYGITFKVNLQDYLDTGLFLDHRETRRFVGQISEGKKVLNLFAYTCSFSVHAAAGGAIFTKSVDMSNTYTDWGRENFLLNSISLKNNIIVRADCLKFLEEEVKTSIRYDVIIIDPPTISKSTKMEGKFDIQRDYIFLLNRALHLLAQNGTIIFNTNFRKFSFDESLFPSCQVVEITKKTIPIDFSHQKIHRCWQITKSR